MAAHAASATDSRARLFRAFADPSRLSIVESLSQGGRTVSEICEMTGLTQPNVSNHLACLLGCGLVDRERRGRFSFYRLADERIPAVLRLAEVIGRGAARRKARCPVCGSDAW